MVDEMFCHPHPASGQGRGRKRRPWPPCAPLGAAAQTFPSCHMSVEFLLAWTHACTNSRAMHCTWWLAIALWSLQYSVHEQAYDGERGSHLQLSFHVRKSREKRLGLSIFAGHCGGGMGSAVGFNGQQETPFLPQDRVVASHFGITPRLAQGCCSGEDCSSSTHPATNRLRAKVSASFRELLLDLDLTTRPTFYLHQIPLDSSPCNLESYPSSLPVLLAETRPRQSPTARTYVHGRHCRSNGLLWYAVPELFSKRK